MYESPIKIIDDIVSQVNMELEGDILKIVRRVNVDVDEEELLKALQYDRDQYKRGYEDGKRDAVVHGRWILHPNGDGTCDQCGRYQKAIWDFDNQQNFCGHCGADMRERDENA